MLLNIGLSHKTAPVSLRERLAIPPERLPDALDALSRRLPDAELVVVSTCNRVEAYLVSDAPDAGEQAADFLAAEAGVPRDELQACLYEHRGEAAIRHLFSVASGLDSMVVGETQINSQVKQAYLAAAERGATGKILNTLFQRAFAVAKEVYRKSGIAQRRVSVSSVAADLARRVFETFDDKTVLILGAGETGELALRRILEGGRPRIIVANRTLERAQNLARRYAAEAIPLDDAPAALADADIVIACTGSPQPVLSRDAVAAAARRARGAPILIIDIAAPRDVDEAAADIDNVYLYNIDDLQRIVEENMEERRRELERCTQIVDQETREFVEWMRANDAAPTIQALKAAMDRIKEGELDRLRPKLNHVSDEDWEQIVQMADRLVNKVAHCPSVTLREQAKRGEHWYVHAVRKLFGLAPADEDGE